MEKLGIPLARMLGGAKTEEHAKAYYEELRRHEFKAAASEAVMSNVEMVRYWARGIKQAVQAVGHTDSSGTHPDKPLETPPPAAKAPEGKSK